MAARKDDAARHYAAYLARLSPDDAAARKVVEARVGRLGVEMEALSKWREAWAIQAEADAYLRKNDPELPGNPALDKASRERITTEVTELLKKMSRSQDLLAELREEDRYASTRWGSVIQPKPHERAAYAGETLPPRPPK
jgi:hypothetical protein